MTPFDKEMKALNDIKKGKKMEDEEFIKAAQRQTQMFLELIKIIENDNKK